MWSRWSQHVRPYLFTLLLLSFIATVASGETAWIKYIEGILALLSFVLSFHAARRMFQIVGSIFITAGIACLLWAHVPLQKLPLLLTSNVMLISLLYMLPFVNHAIRVGGYDRHLSRWLQVKGGRLDTLFVRSLIVSYCLSLFLFFAALPLMKRVLGKYLADVEESTAKRFMASSILPGFGIVAVWSPVEPLVATAVLLTGVSYAKLFPWMFAFSLVLLALGSLRGLAYRQKGALETAAALGSSYETRPTHAPSWSHTFQFFIALAILIGSAFLAHSIVSVSFFTAMTLILLPFSILWAVMKRRFNRFVKISRKKWQENTDGLRHLLVLFLSFGFFNAAIAQTPLFTWLSGPVQAISAWPVLLYICIAVLFLVLPVLGLHPLVVMSVIGLFLPPVLEVISPLSIAVVMIICSLASAFMGTFNSTVTIMSGLLQVNPYRITLWNLVFGVVFAVVGVIAGLLLL
ncbi:hypothetical protein [Paenibacillus cremeus]|uniref:Permease n=1 Tax=Paenibacillus cremeus TaxID=2163881 RepID=A0A559KG26_9BACL|nr:hypothetical protein [Paenibacillus cremeus]TVY11083.1 hypothetical protein FPZ49_04335 [Paenibacillus cremeus]